MKKSISYVLLACITATAIIYVIHYNHASSVYAVIPAEVYRSAQLDGDGFESAIKTNALRTIINLRGVEPRKQWYKDEIAVSGELGVTHHDLSLSPHGLPRRRSARQLANLLQTVNKPVLVHCKNGSDRAGLASAIALLSQGDSTLDEIAKQVSMRYLALDPDSTGKLFFRQYRNWLEANKLQHTKERFLAWLENDYIDEQGNLYYYIDSINGTIWKKETQYDYGYAFMVDRKKNAMLEIHGWAFDGKQGTLVNKVSILLDSKPAGDVQYEQSRPDVARQFNNPRLARAGWKFSRKTDDFADGCYDLSFDIERLDGTHWLTRPEARVCLE